MDDKITAERVRVVLRPYALLYLGKLCDSYACQAESVFMGVFRPQFGGGDDVQHGLACMDLEMREIEKVARDIRSVDDQETLRKG